MVPNPERTNLMLYRLAIPGGHTVTAETVDGLLATAGGLTEDTNVGATAPVFAVEKQGATSGRLVGEVQKTDAETSKFLAIRESEEHQEKGVSTGWHYRCPRTGETRFLARGPLTL
jgi:hypothetical protein